MPQKDMSSIKNKEQYEALREKGMNKEKAARIANTPDSGKKGGKSEEYENRTKKSLYQLARKLDIRGRSDMSKEELIKALRNS